MARKSRLRVYSNPHDRTRNGDASSIFKRASDELRPGIKVLVLCRESIEANREKLADQNANLRQRIETLGATYVGAYGFVASGYERHERDGESLDTPSWSLEVMRAVALAKQLGATHLLMESVDRGVRSPFFHPSQCPSAGARERDLREFRELTEGLVLVTDVDPKATHAEVAAYRSRRGQALHGRKGGRPKQALTPVAGYKKALRLRKQPKALKLHQRGHSHREIATKLSIPRTTVQRWVSES